MDFYLYSKDLHVYCPQIYYGSLKLNLPCLLLLSWAMWPMGILVYFILWGFVDYNEKSNKTQEFYQLPQKRSQQHMVLDSFLKNQIITTLNSLNYILTFEQFENDRTIHTLRWYTIFRNQKLGNKLIVAVFQLWICGFYT